MNDAPIQVQVQSLDHHGLGMGVHVATGQVIRQIPKVLPGEKVTGYIKKNGFQVLSRDESSPSRCQPICPVFDRCGGCQLQHLGQTATLELKRDGIVKIFEGLLDSEKITWKFAGQSGQRRRVSLSYRKEKEAMKVGFFVQHTHFLVSIDECPLLTSALNACIQPLKVFLDQILDLRDEGFIHLTDTLTGIDCSWSPRRKDEKYFQPQLWQKWAEFGAAHGFARITRAGKELIAEFQKPMVDLGGLVIDFPPAGFLQPSVQSQKAMQDFVVQSLVQRGFQNGKHRIIDLFCGIGTFSIPLLPFGSVHSIDVVGPWIDGLKKYAHEMWTHSARDLMRNPLSLVELYPYDVIVLDPPRAGAHAQTQILSQNASAQVIIMTSCDLTTAARDAKILTERNYQLVECALFDQFPWTNHCEGILVFEKLERA